KHFGFLPIFFFNIRIHASFFCFDVIVHRHPNGTRTSSNLFGEITKQIYKRKPKRVKITLTLPTIVQKTHKTISQHTDKPCIDINP
ncbi:MAG: hypothetical protein PQJ44_00870, partial [Sphaerochaetaceae bacterium]|nr:hypothetical protein [Sphaerochaetaceae bacterium]